MTKKRIVCFCEDVTQEEIEDTIDQGFQDMESVKRFTGAFMGPCQGKQCAANILRIFSERVGKEIDSITLPTMRAPVKPVPLGVVAGESETDSRNEPKKNR
jgi:bacterioferritin-associated ferredoxin